MYVVIIKVLRRCYDVWGHKQSMVKILMMSKVIIKVLIGWDWKGDDFF